MALGKKRGKKSIWECKKTRMPAGSNPLLTAIRGLFFRVREGIQGGQSNAALNVALN